LVSVDNVAITADCSFPVAAATVDIDHGDYKQSFSTLPARFALLTGYIQADYTEH